MRRPAAVLLDLDGTLIDSRDDISAACNHALVSRGKAALPAELVRTFVGDGARRLVARALNEEPDAPEVGAALEHFHAYYRSHPVVHTTWMPGARELMKALPALGVRMAVVTNKPETTALLVLEALGVNGVFGAVVGAGRVALKPDPAPVQAALAALGIDAGNAWMVGDGPQDVGAGHAAGCRTIGVRGGFVPEDRLRAARPDVMLGSLLELLPLVG